MADIDTTTRVQDTYSHAPLHVRDLTGAFQIIQQKSPAFLLSLIPFAPDSAKNPKHEWLEDVITPQEWTLTVAYTAADGQLTVADTSLFTVGMRLEFEDATSNKTPNMVATVTGITSGTVIAITMDGTDTNLANGSTVKLVADPQAEGSESQDSKQQIPGSAYNYTQIFARTAKLTGSQQSTQTYGNIDLSYHEMRKLWEIYYEMNQSLISGRKYMGADNSEKRTMGGIREFLEDAGSVFDASNASFSLSIFNQAMEQAKGNGATGINVAVTNPEQASNIAALNTGGNNPVVMRAENMAGHFVSVLQDHMGSLSYIFYDRNFPKDKMALVDTSMMELVDLEGRSLFAQDATPPGADYEATRLIGEYTLRMKNASTSHILIDDLAVN